MIIYIDMIFIKELFINFIIIFCTSKVINKKIKLSKCIISSSISSIYTIVSLFCTPISNIIGRIIFAISLNYYTFKDKTIIELIKTTICFYLISFLLAGIYLYTKSNMFQNVIYLVVTIILISELIKGYKEKYRISNYIADIELIISNEKIKLKALVDTGNTLKSSESEDVIVLSPKSIRQIKDENIKELLIKNRLTEKIQNELGKKDAIRTIIFTTINKRCGVKYGLKLKEIKCNASDKIILKEGVVICADSDFYEYDAIVTPDFINNV